ncbi:bifunctional glutamine synthetase adenylyltransferase/deadenyltransferase, partial [Pseudomonas aeruginosa]
PNDEEGLLNAFRFFKKTQVLAVAASDVLADRPLMKVSDSLTFIAEVVLEKALQRVFGELVKKHGYPVNAQGEPVSEAHNGFAIIGYGKLGGLEMSYSSDLDLVFIHDIDEEAMTLGEKPISGMKFAARLAQKLMNYLTTQTRDGRVYEIDMRLRPSGQAG